MLPLVEGAHSVNPWGSQALRLAQGKSWHVGLHQSTRVGGFGAMAGGSHWSRVTKVVRAGPGLGLAQRVPSGRARLSWAQDDPPWESG